MKDPAAEGAKERSQLTIRICSVTDSLPANWYNLSLRQFKHKASMHDPLNLSQMLRK